MERTGIQLGRRGVSRLPAGQKVQDQPALRPVRHPAAAGDCLRLCAAAGRAAPGHGALSRIWGPLSARLDKLYGASVDYTVRKQGENQCVGFVASFIDDRYAPGGEQLLEPVAELLGELVCDPVTYAGPLCDRRILRAKRPTCWTPSVAMINDKRDWADSRLLRETVRWRALRRCLAWATRRRLDKLQAQQLYDHVPAADLHRAPGDDLQRQRRSQERVAARRCAALSPRSPGTEVPEIIARTGPIRLGRRCSGWRMLMDVTQGKLGMGFACGSDDIRRHADGQYPLWRQPATPSCF